jgi:transcriptional regulator with XRE-family HTH domain
MAAARTARRPWLAEARERTGRSQESLARHIGVSAKTVSWWERGVSTPRPDKQADLAEALGFTMDELGRHLGLASAPDQAAPNGDPPGAFASITGWLSMFVRAEQSAHAIWTLDTHAFPALCQTADYARAVEVSGHHEFTPNEIDGLVRQRIERAAVLHRAEFTAVIAAPLLDAIKGGAEIMAGQMSHLLDLADRSTVTLRLIDMEHLSAAPGRFTLLATDGMDPDTALEIGVRGPVYTEGNVADHVRLFSHLVSLARDPEASRAMIARSADRFSAMANTMKGTRTR